MTCQSAVSKFVHSLTECEYSRQPSDAAAFRAAALAPLRRIDPSCEQSPPNSVQTLYAQSPPAVGADGGEHAAHPASPRLLRAVRGDVQAVQLVLPGRRMVRSRPSGPHATSKRRPSDLHGRADRPGLLGHLPAAGPDHADRPPAGSIDRSPHDLRKNMCLGCEGSSIAEPCIHLLLVSIYLSINLSIGRSIHPPIDPSIHLSSIPARR